MRILVTGATGGLGELIIDKLKAKGVEIVSTSRRSEKAAQCDYLNGTTYIPYDIGSRSDLDLYSYFGKPDLVIHLAWEKLDQYKTDEHTGRILDDHKHFVSNLIENGLKDVTVVGTCYEYGLQEGMLSEDMQSKPGLPYSVAKNALRLFIEEKRKEKNISFKWIRIFYVFGEVKGRKNLYTHLITAIKNKDESFNMSGGEQVRDFLTPAQIAEYIIMIASQCKIEGIINCCSGKPVKLKEFILDFLKINHYNIRLNLGVFPYPDYEPMNTWGSTEKLDKIVNN